MIIQINHKHNQNIIEICYKNIALGFNKKNKEDQNFYLKYNSDFLFINVNDHIFLPNKSLNNIFEYLDSDTKVISISTNFNKIKYIKSNFNIGIDIKTQKPYILGIIESPSITPAKIKLSLISQYFVDKNNIVLLPVISALNLVNAGIKIDFSQFWSLIFVFNIDFNNLTKIFKENNLYQHFLFHIKKLLFIRNMMIMIQNYKIKFILELIIFQYIILSIQFEEQFSISIGLQSNFKLDPLNENILLIKNKNIF